MSKQAKERFQNGGLYAALGLCVLALGVGGYFLLADQKPPEQPPAPVQAPAPAPVKRPPAVVETVRPRPLPERAPEQEAEVPVMEEVPMEAEEPRVVVLPLEGEVAAVFSMDTLVYDETMEDWRTHAGVDISAAENASVLAASAGTVEKVEDDPLMGTTVVISHSGGYQTTYASLQKDPPVKAGDEVSAGQIIGAVGTTAAAESAQGPHLHFSVTHEGKVVDPDDFLGK